MDVGTRPNGYEGLQALVVGLLFFVHIVLFMAILIGGVHIGLAVGLVGLVLSWRLSGEMTLRATEPPPSVGSALGGLRLWLLIFGAVTAIFSVAYFAAIVITME